jgi:riboflavin transporter FmnP
MLGSWIGIVATGLIAWLGYFFGVPLWAIFAAVSIGTIVEFTILKRSSEDQRSGK